MTPEQPSPSIPSIEAQSQGHEALRRGLAHRADAIQSVNKAKATLGEVAAGHEYRATSGGVVMTDKEYEHDVLGKAA